MKLSIDFDGTLWDHMAFFRSFMVAMQAQGHQVGILTGHTQESEANDVALMRARGFPAPDFFYGKTQEETKFNGAISKVKKILEEGIDIHFDDYDYANPETERLFWEGLGSDHFHKLIRVHHRDPVGTHFE